MNPLEETQVASHTNARILTQTGQAVIAVGMAASGGALAPLSMGVMGTAGMAAATTAATQVVTTTINNGGNLGRGIKTLDDKESLQAMAISGLTAGLTAGASQAAGLNGATSTTSTTSASTSTASASTASTISSTATTSERLISEAGTALTRASIGATSYSVANSIVTGQSLGDSLKENYKLENIAIQAAGEVGAKEIGIAYHGTTDANGNYIKDPISQPLQLTLHAVTGCALGSQSGNCAAGAAGAVAGELIAESYFKNKLEENGAIIQGNNVIIDPTKTDLTLNEVQQFKNTAVELAKLGGAIAAVPFAGSDNSGNAINIGSYAGGNSAGNNAIYVGGVVKVPYSDKITGKGNDYDLHSGLQIALGLEEKSIGTDGKGSSFYVIPEFGIGGYINYVPHNENVDKSFSLGYRNFGSVDYLKTKQGNVGFGATIGISTSPLTKIPGNITIDNTQ